MPRGMDKHHLLGILMQCRLTAITHRRGLPYVPSRRRLVDGALPASCLPVYYIGLPSLAYADVGAGKHNIRCRHRM